MVRRRIIVVGTVHGNRAITVSLASSFLLAHVVPHPPVTKCVLRFKPITRPYVENRRSGNVGCVGRSMAATAAQDRQVQREEDDFQQRKATVNQILKPYSILRMLFIPTMKTKKTQAAIINQKLNDQKL